MADEAREAAFQSLIRLETEGAYSNLLVNGFSRMQPTDRAFASVILFGVTERRRALDLLIDRCAEKAPDAKLRILLRCGLYQLLYLDRVPDGAACDETVKLARKFFGERQTGFVNALLRRVCRNREEAQKIIASAPTEIRCSFCDGLAALLREQYPDRADAIMEASCLKRPLFLRVNPMKASPEEIAARFGGEADGNTVTLKSRHAEAVRQADGGEFFIQGYGSQAAVKLLDAQPGDTVVDVCACPGGKSLGAALDMQNEGTVYSFDIHENKLPLIEKGARALGISVIRTRVQDARETSEELKGKADRVICDVPCSGLGVIGAKPEVRYKDPEAFSGLYPTQKRILSASAEYLKPGGVLVYSTCTWNKKENEDVVSAFMDSVGAEYIVTEQNTLLPDGEAGEGFFTAKIRKNG